MSKIIKIIKEGEKQRLDVYLTANYKDGSRGFWQKKIKAGEVLLNGEPSKAHAFLKIGDKIKIVEAKKQKIKKIKKQKYKLLFECADYLIVEKPAGFLTHRTNKELGLADQLLQDYPEIEGVGEKYRYGIVHRLDRDVSGVLLIARSEKFFNHIKKQFKNRNVKKIYLGLVYGKIEKNEGILDFAIGRSRAGKMAARAKYEEGKEAKTYFEVLERIKNYTYLQIQIFTGRTHQIRAHMLAYGHPIVGDTLYKSKKYKQKDLCGRMFLHSYIIGFKDLKGKEVEYKSKLPKELEICLKKINSKS